MKKLLFIFFLALIGLDGNAQNSLRLRDLKDMIEKGYADSLLLSLDSLDKNAVIDSTTLSNIKKDIFLIRQDYSLYNERTKKMYGYDDQDHFGTSYSFGLKCDGFNILFDQAVHPWNYDEKYEQFASDELIPQITSTWYNLINDSISSGYIQTDSVIVPIQQVKENFVYASKSFTQAQQGFEVNNADTCKSGIVVWICLSKGSIDSDSVHIQLKQTLIQTEMFGQIPVSPPSHVKNIIGALYFTKGNGPNRFCLSGVVQQKNGKNILEFPFKNFNYAKQDKAIVKKTGKLTEIKK